MLVSNFEVIIVPREINTYQETSYELIITNLEDIDIEFLIECHVGATGLHYGAVNLADLFIDIRYGDIVSEPGVYEKGREFIRPIYFVIPAKISAVVVLRNPIDVQIRGYLALRVPPVRNRSHYLITMQQSSPVKVLLAASRQDFCRPFLAPLKDENGNRAYEMYINSWVSRQCIELASGKALNEIEPEGTGLFTKVSEVLTHLSVSDDLQHRIMQETTSPILPDDIAARE